MRLALMSDVHANLHALQATLTDIDALKPDRIYCLGDLVGYGAFPNEVIDLIRARKILTVMGNYDDGVGFERDTCGCAYTDPESRRLGDLSFVWTKETVISENRAFLRGLAREIRLEAKGRHILLVHGSPRRINEYLYEDRPSATFRRLAAAAAADLIAFGHTHLPYTKTVDGILFAGVGSVGKPKDGDPRACYALVDVAHDSLKVEFRRVPYDVEAAASAVRASGLPEHFAEALEKGRG
ncbi:MAG: metallophosphatase family protein [Chloroflexi bacterium]|nr:metallophosphatase family protein [Chloroflexota bacterium]